MTERSLPGLQARYEFVPAGDAAELRLFLRFDPALCDAAAPPQAAWLEVQSRFAEAAAGTSPPGSIGVVTGLASRPLVATADGFTVRERLASFVAEVLADAAKVVDAELAFTLAKTGAKALHADFCPIDVRLDYGGGDRVTASPRLDGDLGLYPFAAAFEDAWRGFDGAAGRLALFASGPDETPFWSVRTGTGGGISIATPDSAAPTHYAIPPLALVPLDGTIDSEDGAPQRMSQVDLDRWWGLFAEAVERFAVASDGETGERLAGVRRRLAAALAPRLAPIGPAADEDGIEELRAVCETLLAEDLRSRPVLLGAAVDIGRGDTSTGAAGAVLSGRAYSPIGAAAAAGGSPAAVRLDAGRRRLAFAAPAQGSFSIRFEGDRIESRGAPPLDLVLHAPGEANALAVDIGPHSAPSPLIALPAPPTFASVAATSAATQGATLGEALQWAVEVAIPEVPAEQDRLELAIVFDDGREPTRAAAPGLPNTLFDALGRAVLFVAGLPAEPEPGSLAAFAGLAEAVADALPAWRAPPPDTAAMPGDRRYGFEFDSLPALVVTRHSGSGPLPPWPEIRGYCAPDCDGEKARYEPAAGAAGPGLLIAVPGFRLLAKRRLRVEGRFVRNRALGNPAFVYHGPIASTRAAVSPFIEWGASRPEAPAVTLEAALLAVLGRIEGGSRDPYILRLEAALVRPLEAAGEEPAEVRIPLLLIPETEIGGASGPSLAGHAKEVAAALSRARAAIGPDGGKEEIALAIALSDPSLGPLARLSVRIPVPEDAGLPETAR